MVAEMFPALRPLGIGRGHNAAGLGPGQFLFRREAAAVPPALFGARAAAGMVHARIGLAAILGDNGRERDTEGSNQVGNESQAG
jgi:hypothetical protein